MKNDTYLTADWHLFGSKVIEYSKRPFKDVEHMHRVLVNNYNNTVPEYGICYMLGDMLQGPVEGCKEIIDSLNGTKILILGNHDPNPTRAMRCGFDAVMNVAGIVIGKELVTMTHCPLRGVWREDVTGMRGATEGENWHKESVHWRFSIDDFGQFHAHGHTHAPNGGRSQVRLGRQFDVGVDGNNYTPVSAATVESWIFHTKKREQELREFADKVLDENAELMQRLSELEAISKEVNYNTEDWENGKLGESAKHAKPSKD